MKILKPIIMTVATAALVCSCDLSLDENVYSSITSASYIYTTKDLDAVVAAPYQGLRDFCSHGGMFCAQEVSGDAIVMPPNSSGWDDGGIYRRIHYHTWTSEQSHVSSMWGTFYLGALRCNDAIAKIEDGTVPTASESEKNAAIAELRALRAYWYWLICDNFGDAPLVTDPTNLDLPAKTPRKEIYDFIVKELNEAIPNLSEIQGGTMYARMNKWAAKALLANIYINAEVYTGTPAWDKCLQQCNDIINSGKCGLEANYKDCFKATGMESSKEILFTIAYDPVYGGGNYMYFYTWNGKLKEKFNTKGTPWGSGCAAGVPQFIDTYDEEDGRLADSWLMGPQYSKNGDLIVGGWDGKPLIYVNQMPDGEFVGECEGYRMNKFEIEEQCNYSTSDIPIFRYAEILLMKAECLLRTGQPGAGAIVTELRQRNFKNNPAKAVVTDEELAGNSSYQYGEVNNYVNTHSGDQSPVKYGRLLDEYGWEFAWELHRRRDNIRFGTFQTKSWLSHKGDTQDRTVFPIPEKVLTANPQLEQNPLYK